MPDPAQAKELADAGGWAVAVFLVIVIAIGGHRKWWVFGWIYDRQEKRADTLVEQLERNTDALAKLTAAVDRLRTAQRDRAGRPDAGP